MAAMNAEKKMTTRKMNPAEMTMTFVRKCELELTFEQWWRMEGPQGYYKGDRERGLLAWGIMCSGTSPIEVDLRERDYLTMEDVEGALEEFEPDSEEESEEEEVVVLTVPQPEERDVIELVGPEPELPTRGLAARLEEMLRREAAEEAAEAVALQRQREIEEMD